MPAISATRLVGKLKYDEARDEKSGQSRLISFEPAISKTTFCCRPFGVVIVPFKRVYEMKLAMFDAEFWTVSAGIESEELITGSLKLNVTEPSVISTENWTKVGLVTSRTSVPF